MFNTNSKQKRGWGNRGTKIVFLFLLINNTYNGVSARDFLMNTEINFDKNPVLISDSLKKVDAKLFLNTSLDQLSENIYLSALHHYLFFTQSFTPVRRNTEFLEVLALNEFYIGNTYQAEQLLTTVFETTTDSLQKAKTCLNLIKINYLNNSLIKAMRFVRIAKDSLSRFYSYKQKYELVFTEAKIALTQGLSTKAENLIIGRALPMSNKVKGKLNEFNCYLFLGKIYLKAGQLTQAKWFFIQANTIAVKQNYVNGKIETSLLLAKTKIKVGDKTVALQDLAKASKLMDNQHQIYLEDLQNLTRLAKQ
ncbi:MAG TPA: hypothetical protein VFM79_06285 [Pelobium sp.]|nr:hypothetical protein [Pelobium sp.]